MVKQADTQNDIMVFDRARICQNRLRASKGFSDFDFLFKWSRNILSDRLYDINRQFPMALHIGSRGGISAQEHDKIDWLSHMDLTPHPVQTMDSPYIQADEEFLPIAQKSLHLVLSNLSLHSVNDLPGALLQIRQSLKEDGLFLASMLGGETLHELRRAMMDIEMELYGGVSPRVAPFADKPQMGDLLQRAGFTLPVVDSEIVTVTYDNVFKLFKDLRGMGEGNAILQRNKQPLSKAFFMRLAEHYHNLYAEKDGRIVASFEVIFLLGWSPHSSQQKPLRPGSAEHSLAEALGATEIKTGERSAP
tara:strand:+ start:785 stop:1699 length:915 start_codon:yes stop_codon:yes gene_type:complete